MIGEVTLPSWANNNQDEFLYKNRRVVEFPEINLGISAKEITSFILDKSPCDQIYSENIMEMFEIFDKRFRGDRDLFGDFR